MPGAMPSIQRKCLSVITRTSRISKAAFSTTSAGLAERSASSPIANYAAVDAPPAQAHQSQRAFQVRRPGPLSIPNRKGGVQKHRADDQGHERLQALIAEQARKRQAKAVAQQAYGKPSGTTAEMLEREELSKSLTTQIKRHFRPGDIYAPHDLSWQEQKRWRKRGLPQYDNFDITNFNPKLHYKNFTVLSEFITPLGRIQSRKNTGLRPVNQRKLAKAIRRTIGMGMMPSVHKHPEILQQLARQRMQINAFNGL